MYLYGKDGRQTGILFAYLLQRRHGDGFEPVRLQGLKPEALYTISELGTRSPGKLTFEGKTFSGEFLMAQGIPMAWPYKSEDYLSRVIRIEEVND